MSEAYRNVEARIQLALQNLESEEAPNFTAAASTFQLPIQ